MDHHDNPTTQPPPSSARQDLALALMVCAVAILAAVVFVRALVAVWS